MEIIRAGSKPSVKAPGAWFTGTVRIDPLMNAFEPGARTAWRTHPLGQTLIVTAGVGRVQRWGAPVREIRPRRRRLDRAGREALARRRADDGDHPYRDPGGGGRQGGRLARARQ